MALIRNKWFILFWYITFADILKLIVQYEAIWSNFVNVLIAFYSNYINEL